MVMVHGGKCLSDCMECEGVRYFFFSLCVHYGSYGSLAGVCCIIVIMCLIVRACHCSNLAEFAIVSLAMSHVGGRTKGQ